jgi:hypothetical protein
MRLVLLLVRKVPRLVEELGGAWASSSAVDSL